MEFLMLRRVFISAGPLLAAPSVVRSAALGGMAPHFHAGKLLHPRDPLHYARLPRGGGGSTTPVTGFPGQAGNPVGYAAYAGYTGSLTPWSGSFTNSGTYSGYLFDGGTSAFSFNATGLTIQGSYVGCSSGLSSTSFCTTTSGPFTANFVTFAPSPSVVGGSFPPQPPSGGGYTTWPTFNGVGITQTLGPQYGPISNGSSVVAGGMTFNSCDIWGDGNGCVFSHIGSTNPVKYDNCWVHDPRNPSPGGDHTDGIGDVQSASNDIVKFLTITGCTVAKVADTQGLAMQMQNNSICTDWTITDNYWAGFAALINIGNVSGFIPGTYTNIVFKRNTMGHLIPAASSVMYGTATTPFNTLGSGNEWRLNTFDGGTYPGLGTVAAGWFLWPDGTAHATDWTGVF